jgi:hypothetical protein
MKCLEKDRKRRYDTANGLAQDLHRHLTHQLITARPPTSTYLLSRIHSAQQTAVAGAAAIFCIAGHRIRRECVAGQTRES